MPLRPERAGDYRAKDSTYRGDIRSLPVVGARLAPNRPRDSRATPNLPPAESLSWGFLDRPKRLPPQELSNRKCPMIDHPQPPSPLDRSFQIGPCPQRFALPRLRRALDRSGPIRRMAVYEGKRGIASRAQKALARSNVDNLDIVQMCPYDLTRRGSFGHNKDNVDNV